LRCGERRGANRNPEPGRQSAQVVMTEPLSNGHDKSEEIIILHDAVDVAGVAPMHTGSVVLQQQLVAVQYAASQSERPLKHSRKMLCAVSLTLTRRMTFSGQPRLHARFAGLRFICLSGDSYDSKVSRRTLPNLRARISLTS